MKTLHDTPPRWRRTEVVAVVALSLDGWRWDLTGAVVGRPWPEVSELLARPGVVPPVPDGLHDKPF